jgi:rhomboid protease GluP
MNELMEEDEKTIIASASYSTIREYSLVLSSQLIIHDVIPTETGPFEIWVSKNDAKLARRQIRLYRCENPPRPNNAPLPVMVTLQPLWILSVPAIITLIQFSDRISYLTSRGISDASLVLKGEWWRLFTALSLHGDAKHVLGNLISGFFVLNLLSLRIPLSRLAAPLLIFSALANGLVSLTMQENFRSLGFSTFVFASLGALSSIEFRLMPKEFHGLQRRFAPLIGALLLAVFMGLGENSDIFAHGYGFILGLVVGFLPKRKSLQWGIHFTRFDILLIISYFALFLCSWLFALS